MGNENKEEFDKKALSECLRSYFRQLSQRLAIALPLFYSLKYRLVKNASLKNLIIDEYGSYMESEMIQAFEKKSVDPNSETTKINQFIIRKIEEFGISSDGQCKFCGVFNINLSNFALKKGTSLNKFMQKSIKSNNEYSAIVTSIRLHDEDGKYLQDQNAESQDDKISITLNKKLFKHFPNLVNLTLKNLKIDQFDESINQCIYLKNIEFINNQLKEFPKNLFNETTPLLDQIIIDNNPLTNLPYSVFTIDSLKSIVLTRLNLDSLPDGWIDKITNEKNETNLRSIHIAQTRLQCLPTDLLVANKQLEQLTFQGVNLILPENESQWSKMSADLMLIKSRYCPILLSTEEAENIFKRFDVDKNNLLDYKELQSFNAYIFKKFPRLEVLGDLGTVIREKKAENLEKLASMNKIFQIPTLTYLDLSFQAIVSIPNSIGSCKNLKVLKLKYCVYLQKLSSKLGLLKLTELDLTGCISLKTPPIEIQRRGVNSVLAYLARLTKGQVKCKRTKLMLQGLGGAGKTSLMQAILNKTYQNGTQKPPDLTDGIDIRDWKVTLDSVASKEQDSKSMNDQLTFSVFDFAGQVVYYNTHQFFLTNRSIYLLVWNVRLGAEHSGLEFWLNSIEVHAPMSPVLLIGTHIDEVNKYDLPIEKYKKKYPQIKGCFFVSSYNGKGVDELSKAIVDIALKENYMGEAIPSAWLEFESALHDMKSKKNILDFIEIEKIGNNFGIFDKHELNQAIQFLHDLGSLMHFNNEFLRDKVVINPQFMVDLMASLVSVHNNFIVDGKLSHNDVEKIWKKYDPALHTWILKVTEKFDLTFSVPDQKINLVPCLMSETPISSIDWKSIDDISSDKPKKETKIIYEFNYLPSGLFNRAQVRLFQITDNKTIWKNGSLLKKNNHLALILRLENKIEVRVRGVQPENVVFLIHEVFETLIAESFNGITYDFSFPCPDCFDMGSINNDRCMYSASLVRKATQMKAVFLQCRNNFHVIPISDLHGRMPPDSVDNYDLHLRHSVRNLKNLKQKLSYDIVMLYSSKDTQDPNQLHPRQIKQDLEKKGFSCWFTENPDLTNFDSTLLIIRNSSLILFCVSDNACQDDQKCAELFVYSKTVMEKNYVLVALGPSLNWMKSQVGALITNEFFIKINTLERYKTSLPDLIDLVKKKLDSIKNQTNPGKPQNAPQIFISYCRVNSQDAIKKGTIAKNKFCLGWADPRSLKTFLENEGYSVWVDYEQRGLKKTLFEDIVDGIRNCKCVIACISNEYALSENCMKEFRFASNIKMPIIMCLYGSASADAEWKNTELGIMSCLNTKEINFQLENPEAHKSVLSEIQSFKIEPIKKQITISKIESNEIDEKNVIIEEKFTEYSELFELAQRKFLRQVANFSDTASTRPFPRLFCLDLYENLSFVEPVNSISSYSRKQKANSPSVNKSIFSPSSRISSSLSPSQYSSFRNSNLENDSPSSYVLSNSEPKKGKMCLRALCENENGWHPAGGQLEYESLSNIPNNHFAYMIRILSLIKQSNMDLKVVNNLEKLVDIINYIDDNLPSQDEASPVSYSNYSNSRYESNDIGSALSTMNSSYPSHSFKDSYESLKHYIVDKIEKIEQRKTLMIGAATQSSKSASRNLNTDNLISSNNNRIEFFDLNRCSLPNGKILW